MRIKSGGGYHWNLTKSYNNLENKKTSHKSSLQNSYMCQEQLFQNGRAEFPTVKDMKQQLTLTLPVAIQPGGLITRNGGTRPVKG